MTDGKEKKRGTNFSAAECITLSQIMRRGSGVGDLSYHALQKHRYTPTITSDTKKKMWIRVAEAFNSESVINREPNELSKKWDNLVQTHRPKYLDYKRQVNQTGLGHTSVSLSPVTEEVMETIGRDSVSMVGVASIDSGLDSGCIQLDSTIGKSESMVMCGNSNETVIQLVDETGDYRTTSATLCHHCCCSECTAIRGLKRRKLELEVALLSKKLNSQY